MTGTQRRFVVLVGSAIALSCLIGAPGSAEAADPAIVIVDEQPEIRVTPYWPEGSAEDSGCDRPDRAWRPFGDRRFDHRVTVLLRNDSAQDRTLSMAIVTRDGESHPLAVCNGDVLAAGESRVVVARAGALDGVALGSAIVVTASSADSVLSATSVTSTSVLPHSAKYWAALALAVAAGAAVTALGVAMCWSGLRSPIKTDKGWKLGDSWATTITAAGALLTTTLGASGLLEELAPTANGPRLVALGLAFGALAVIAPIATSAFATFTVEAVDDKQPGVLTAQTRPTGLSLLAGGSLTVVGIFGQLTLVGLLLSELDTDEWTRTASAVLLFLAMALVAVYALRTWHSLTVLAGSTDGKTASRSVSPGL